MTKKLNRNLVSLTLISIILIPKPGYTDDPPKDCTKTITHPAQYVDQKVKRSGIACIFAPHCCTPAWVTDPVCYVVQKKKIKEASEEIVNDIDCLQQEGQRLYDIAKGKLSDSQIVSFIQCMHLPSMYEAGTCLGAILTCTPAAAAMGVGYGVCVGVHCGTAGAEHAYRCAKENNIVQ